MATMCASCSWLIESSFLTEPHEQLIVLKACPSGATIYRCRLCHTSFEFTEEAIYLLTYAQRQDSTVSPYEATEASHW